MKKLIVLLFSAALLSACSSTPSPKAAGIKELDEEMAKKCQFVGTVFGSSMWGIAVADISRGNSLIEAKEKAAQLGATHILIGRMKAADMNGGAQVSSRAYRCR